MFRTPAPIDSPTSRRATRSAIASIGLLLALALGACSSGTAPAATRVAPAPLPAPTTATTLAPSNDGARPDRSTGALVARSDTDVEVLDAPDGAPVRTVPARNEFGSPLALLVLDRATGWLEVLLPGRPTGGTGWVRRDAVELRRVAAEVHVDLAARTLVLLQDGDEVLRTPVAIGSPDAPTPTGRFSLTDKIASVDPSGPYGPFALGLSARSEVLTEFAGGDGQIGIHGTNDPSSIGEEVSSGCIRVPNEVVEALNDALPLGTPIVVG